METVTKLIGREFQLKLPSQFSKGSQNSISEKIETGLAVGEKKTLIQVVSDLGKKDKLTSLLSSIGNDDYLLRSVLKKSYKHHNGFHKIVLFGTDVFKLRLHLFRPIVEMPLAMENIHNHRWNFASNIITGKLSMELFNENAIGDVEMNNYTYIAKGATDQYKVEYLGKTHLQRLSSIQYDSGCTYYMRSQELHRIINPDNVETCTLMMTGFPVSNNCNLYSQFKFKEEKQGVLTYTKNEILNLFQSIIGN